MRFAYRALIFAAALAVAGTSRGQDSNAPPPETKPTPDAAQAPADAPAATQAAPVQPAPDAVPAPVEAAPVETAPATPQAIAPPVAVAPPPAAVEAAPPAATTEKKAVTHEKKAVTQEKKTSVKARPGKPAAEPAIPETVQEKAPEAAAAGTALDAGQNPPPGADASASTAAPSAVVPAPVAEQAPVVQPTAEEAPVRHKTGSLWLLIGGLAVGLAGIVSMLLRRRDNDSDSVSIVDHTSPSTSVRPPIVVTHRP